MSLSTLCPRSVLPQRSPQYPTQLARCFFKLGQIHGHAKISYTLLSMGLPDEVLKIMESFLQYGKAFKVEGYDF